MGTTLSLPVPAGLSQSPSDKQQRSANHHACDEVRQIAINAPFPKKRRKKYQFDLNCACFLAFPPKIVIWDRVEGWGVCGGDKVVFVFGVIMDSFHPRACSPTTCDL